MKKLLFVLSALVSAAFAACSAWGDTPIPEGLAEYKATLMFTDYPELNNFGDWPVEFDFKFGTTVVGSRRSVVANPDGTTTLVVDMTMDVAQMLTQTQSDGQMHIHARNKAYDIYGPGSQKDGTWVSQNSKLEIDKINVLEDFFNQVSSRFKDKEMWVDAAHGGSGTKVTLKELEFSYVRDCPSTVIPEGEALYDVTVSFNKPFADPVQSFQILNQPSQQRKVLDLSVDNVSVSADRKVLRGVAMANLASTVATINSAEYQAQATEYKAQTQFNLNGTRFATGSLGFLGRVNPLTMEALSLVVQSPLLHRDGGKDVRIVGISITPRAKGGSLMFMKW